MNFKKQVGEELFLPFDVDCRRVLFIIADYNFVVKVWPATADIVP